LPIFLAIKRYVFGNFVEINVPVFTSLFLQQTLQQQRRVPPLQKHHQYLVINDSWFSI
jgi:hypothetical protein